jgi:hypothetical protein
VCVTRAKTGKKFLVCSVIRVMATAEAKLFPAFAFLAIESIRSDCCC